MHLYEWTYVPMNLCVISLKAQLYIRVSARLFLGNTESERSEYCIVETFGLLVILRAIQYINIDFLVKKVRKI